MQQTGRQERTKRESYPAGNPGNFQTPEFSNTGPAQTAPTENPTTGEENRSFTETRTDRLEKPFPQSGFLHSSRLKPEEDAFFIKSKDFYIKIRHADILAVEASRNYCTFHLRNERTECAICSLRHMEDILPASIFLRINRSIILNIKAVDRICGNMLFIGKKSFTVGPSFREEIFSCFHILRTGSR